MDVDAVMSFTHGEGKGRMDPGLVVVMVFGLRSMGTGCELFEYISQPHGSLGIIRSCLSCQYSARLDFWRWSLGVIYYTKCWFYVASSWATL